MAASKVNYIVLYKGHSQVYGCASKKIALESAPPDGLSLSDKRILFITFEPDNEDLSVHLVDQSEIENAEIKTKKEKKKENE